MTTPIQSQLDDFARRLRALEAEFTRIENVALAQATLEEVAAAPLEPELLAAPGRLLSERLAWARERIEAGDTKAALKTLERDRGAALGEEAIAELRDILELARLAASTAASGRWRASAGRLAYTVEQNVGFLERRLGLSHPPELEPQVASAVPPAPLPSPALARPRPESNAGEPPPVRLGRPERVRVSFQPPELELADLLGARALAVAGGVVTLLGIVFFFVLAVNRGWIDPLGRVGLGAGASLAVFLAGVELRRRYGETHATLAAVGVGIAGGYATLLAAAALYDLLPDYAALAVASVIAAVGLATALAWRSQLTAAFGLLGAMLVPVAVVAQGGLSALGTAFVAVVLFAAVVVSLRRRWRWLLVANVVASAPQIAVLVFQAGYHGQSPWRIVLLVAVYSLVYLASGIGYQLTLGTAPLSQLTTSLTVGGGVLALASALRLYATLQQKGLALLAITLCFGLLAAVFFRRRARDLSAFLAAAGFTIGALALADLLSGQPLAYAWAAEAAALAWLAHRTRELRFQVWSAVYLLLSLGHVLALDAPPSRLFVAADRPAAGAATALALAAAAAAFARYGRPSAQRFASAGGVLRLLDGFFVGFQARQRLWRDVSLWSAGILVTYALSLGTLALFSSFDWGYVALTLIWSLIGLGVLLTGSRVGSSRLRRGGLVWVGVTALVVVVHGVRSLDADPRGWSFLALAAALLSAGLAHQLLAARPLSLEPVTSVSTLASVALACDAIVILLNGETGVADRRGAALLALALLYGGLSVSVFRRRDQRGLSTLLGGFALGLGAVALGLLLSGTYGVLAWTAVAVALAWQAGRAGESRLLGGAAVYLAIALGRAVVVDVPPTHLFAARVNPGQGVPAVLIVALGVAVCASIAAADTSLLRKGRAVSGWLAGVLAVYGVSLSILELSERVFPHASLQTEFQRGHTAVSAFWGLLGLGLLYAGLKRWPVLRIAGLVLFAVSLGKIFLYDLPALSSITRALSFLAVGAVLLLGGFFYQRLSSTRSEAGAGLAGGRDEHH